MIVHRHCEKSITALNKRLPIPAHVIVARLRNMPPPEGSLALEVCRLKWALGTYDSSNGNSLVIIIREGVAITAMLRRTWNQPFTPASLRVDEAAALQWAMRDGLYTVTAMERII